MATPSWRVPAQRVHSAGSSQAASYQHQVPRDLARQPEQVVSRRPVAEASLRLMAQVRDPTAERSSHPMAEAWFHLVPAASRRPVPGLSLVQVATLRALSPAAQPPEDASRSGPKG